MLLQIIPRLVYHAEDEFLDRIGDQHLQIKRDPVTVLTLSVLLGASFLSLGTWNSFPSHPESALL